MDTPKTYKVGDIIRLKVKNVFPDCYELIDEYGSNTYIRGLKGLIQKNQMVECRVTKLDKQRPLVEVIRIIKENKTGWSFSRDQVAELLDKDMPMRVPFATLLVSEQDAAQFEQTFHRWITHQTQKNISLSTFRKDVDRFLHYSEFLNLCNDKEREIFGNRLTDVIELTGYYIYATQMLESQEGKAEQFINDILVKLQASGYVYHPKKNFYILLSLFFLKPELMTDFMNQFFGVLYKRELSFWQEQQYAVFVYKLIERYIQVTNTSIDSRQPFDEHVNLLMQALAVNLLFSKEDNSLNKARLYRYATYHNLNNSGKLLDMAWMGVFNQIPAPVFKLDQVSNTVQLSAVLGNSYLSAYEERAWVDDNQYVFSKQNIHFEYKKGRISIRPAGRKNNLHEALPKGTLTWHEVSILLDQTLDRKGWAKNDDIRTSNMMWKDIEHSLFQPAVHTPVVFSKRSKTAALDEVVYIYVVKQDEYISNIFHCRIADGQWAGMTGTVKVYNDIVGYKLSGVTVQSFISKDGYPLVFPARITNLDEEDNFVFSMREFALALQKDNTSYDICLICSIGSYSPQLDRYSAVSREGYSISVAVDKAQGLNLRPYDVVEVSNISHDNEYYLYADVMRKVDEEFLIQNAFRELVLEMAEDEYVEMVEEESEDDNKEVKLSEEQMYEIMRIIDRRAAEEQDYIRSYNYLALAKLLAVILGFEERVRFYKGRMGLIELLYDFAVNDSIDETKLGAFGEENLDLFRQNSPMQKRYAQLNIVSMMGSRYDVRLALHLDMNEALGEDTNKKELYNLASLVLTHNLLREQGLHRQAEEVHVRIKEMLKIKGHSSVLRNYGTESVETEFKTSAIYPAGAMTANPESQMRVIMQVISSMLNTRGGRIYIGVNDAGTGCGIDADLEHSLFNHVKDKYIRFIRNHIINCFGTIASSCINVSFDEGSPNIPVCIISIQPYMPGVEIDGKWYTRQDSRKVEFTQQEFEEYNRTTRRIQGSFDNIITSSGADDSTDDNTAEPAVVTTTEAESTPWDVQTGKKEEVIPTSRHRFRNYEERYDCDSYLNLYINGKYMLTNYICGGIGCSLPLYPEDEYVVIVYESGRYVAVPCEWVMDKTYNREFYACKGERIAFASTAGADDVLFLRYIIKNKEYVWCSSLKKVNPADINDKGQTFAQDAVDSIVMAEIIPADKTNMYMQKSIGKNGWPADQKTAKQIIAKVKEVCGN